MKGFDRKVNPIVITQRSMKITINNTLPIEETTKDLNQKLDRQNSNLENNQEENKSIPIS